MQKCFLEAKNMFSKQDTFESCIGFLIATMESDQKFNVLYI